MGIRNLIDLNPQDLGVRRARADLLRQADFDVVTVPTPTGTFRKIIELTATRSP